MQSAHLILVSNNDAHNLKTHRDVRTSPATVEQSPTVRHTRTLCLSRGLSQQPPTPARCAAVLVCSGAGLAPPADLPSDVTLANSGEVVAGARARFTCPPGEKFSSGVTAVSRLCSDQERLEPASADPLTCVNGESHNAPFSLTVPPRGDQTRMWRHL